MANYYYKSTGTTWNAASSWDSPTPGTTATVIPTATDDVIFNATSGSTCNVNVAGATLVGSCRNLTTTGYTGTITLNVDLQVFGPTIIVANTTFAGAGWFTIVGASPAVARTMNSNGVYFPNFQLGSGGAILNAITFNDVLNVGNIRQGASNGITTNGSSVSVNNSMTMEATAYGWLGTTVYNLVGTGNGNFGMTSTLPSFQNTININKTGGGTITFLSNIYFANATFTYIAGNVVTTGNTTLFNFTNTITSKNGANEILFNNIRAGSAGALATTTLGSDMRVLGNFEVAQQNGYNFNGNTIYVRGNILNPSGVTNGGTSVMEMEGSVAATINGGLLQRSLTINKTGGVSVTVVVNVTTGLTWGAAGRTLLVPASQTLALSTGLTLSAGTFDCSAGTFTPNLQTVSLNANTRSINMGSTNKFYNLTVSAAGSVVTMLSKIDITNNLTMTGASNFNGAFNITVGGDLSGGTLTNTSASQKLIITGTSTNLSTISTFFTGTSPALEVDCGSNGFRLTGTLGVAVFNYLASNTGSFITTGSTMRYYACTINMNFKTVSWNILSNTVAAGTTGTILSDVYCVQFGPTANSDIINSSGGSFNIVTTGSTGAISFISGTAGLRFEGSSNAAWNQTAATTNTMRTIEFAKTLPGTVSIPNSFTYTGILKYVSGAVTHAATLTLGTGSTVNTTSAVSWNNITIPAAATIAISSEFLITNSLVLSGNATFTGVSGWNTGNFTHGGSGTTCTLQAGSTYRVNGLFTMIGTSTVRATLQSSDVANVTVSIPVSPSLLMTVSAGTIPSPAAGYVLGSVAFSTALNSVLSNLLPDRPTIASGSASPYTLTAPIGITALTSYVGQVGKKAFFIVTNNGTSSTNVVYAQTRDIDSNGGITIFASQSYTDALGQPSPNLFRTLNWLPLVAPSGSVYYTFIN